MDNLIWTRINFKFKPLFSWYIASTVYVLINKWVSFLIYESLPASIQMSLLFQVLKNTFDVSVFDLKQLIFWCAA